MRSVNRLRPLLHKLVGLECWHVNAGGAAGSTFSLALGERVLRDEPLRNPSVSAQFRKYTGAANLYVWCAWRLDASDPNLVASSDQSPRVFKRRLQSLLKQRVRRASASPPAHDLSLEFDQATLRVFCDHVPPNPTFDGNWELVTGAASVEIGPGYSVNISIPR